MFLQGVTEKSRMSASPFSLEDGSVTFSERRDCCYLSAMNGEHKGRCNKRRLLPIWRWAMQLECHSDKQCCMRELNSFKAGRWKHSLKMRQLHTRWGAEALPFDSSGFKSQPWFLLIRDIIIQYLGQWYLPCRIIKGVSDIGDSAWCIVSDSWCLTVVHLALVIHIASLLNISFKPLDMNDSS